MYEELLGKEDEFNKMQMEMSGYAPSQGTLGTGYTYGTKGDQSYAPSQYTQYTQGGDYPA